MADGGMLSIAAAALARVHARVFATLRQPPRQLPGGGKQYARWDVPHVLTLERMQVRCPRVKAMPPRWAQWQQQCAQSANLLVPAILTVERVSVAHPWEVQIYFAPSTAPALKQELHDEISGERRPQSQSTLFLKGRKLDIHCRLLVVIRSRTRLYTAWVAIL